VPLLVAYCHYHHNCQVLLLTPLDDLQECVSQDRATLLYYYHMLIKMPIASTMLAIAVVNIINGKPTLRKRLNVIVYPCFSDKPTAIEAPCVAAGRWNLDVQNVRVSSFAQPTLLWYNTAIVQRTLHSYAEQLRPVQRLGGRTFRS
jgi:hypothetical protein